VMKILDASPAKWCTDSDISSEGTHLLQIDTGTSGAVGEQFAINPDSPIPLVIIKVAARCNLSCSYCYEFNLADHTWQHSPALISDNVFENILLRVQRHCTYSGQKSIHLSFHGGEPCLLGPERFGSLCQKARDFLAGIQVKISLQTNGTLLNTDWVRVFAGHAVNVGVSLDGPRQVNDVFRVDHHGQGSYEQVLAGINTLRSAEFPFGILTVIQLGADPLSIHRHFLELGCRSLSYLMPDYTHDTISHIHAKFGPTPCADFLIPIFDDWWFNSTIDVRIRNFWDMTRLVMGGDSQVDALGNRPLYFVVVNSAGDIEGLDVLKACDDGLVKTGLNVRDADFRDIARASSLHGRIVFGSLPLAPVCCSCQERDTCGGGYHPHRYSRERGFNNPSVWCADLLRLFTHIRARLEVSVNETQSRRAALLANNDQPALACP
jgi:uncharacterized protein